MTCESKGVMLFYTPKGIHPKTLYLPVYLPLASLIRYYEFVVKDDVHSIFNTMDWWAFAPLGPFLCPTTEEKIWPIAPQPGPYGPVYTIPDYFSYRINYAFRFVASLCLSLSPYMEIRKTFFPIYKNVLKTRRIYTFSLYSITLFKKLDHQTQGRREGGGGQIAPRPHLNRATT
jgi:hypothetical protein